MTHKDIFTKFMIEYDKANVTSSYPSFTDYEIATVLDKAYLALISQKVTGNNVRRSSFESDIKNIADIHPLILSKRLFVGTSGSVSKQRNRFLKTIESEFESNQYDEDSFKFTAEMRSMPDNMRSVTIPQDLLYFVAAAVPQDMHVFSDWMNGTKFDSENIIKPMDNKKSDYTQDVPEYKSIRMQSMKLVPHTVAEKFFATSSNMPWVKNPVCFFEGDLLYFVVDPIIGIPSLPYINEDTGNISNGEWISLTYIKTPHPFAKDLEKIKNSLAGSDRKDNPYTQTSNIKFTFIIDHFNYEKQNGEYVRTNDGQIHINDMRWTTIDDQTLFTKTGLFYIEDAASTADLSSITVSSLKNKQLVIGTHRAEEATVDDSLTIKEGGQIIAVGIPLLYNDQNEASYGYNCSMLWTLSYSELYRIVQSANIGDAWYEDQVDKVIDVSTFDEDGKQLVLLKNWSSQTSTTIGVVNYTSNLAADGKPSEEDWPDIYPDPEQVKYFEYGTIPDDTLIGSNTIKELYTFELNDVNAEELVSLAITYALENVESSRLNTHLGIRGLES